MISANGKLLKPQEDTNVKGKTNLNSWSMIAATSYACDVHGTLEIIDPAVIGLMRRD